MSRWSDGWVVIADIKNVAWPLSGTFHSTRTKSIGEYSSWWRGGKRRWRRERDAGTVTCVRARIVPIATLAADRNNLLDELIEDYAHQMGDDHPAVGNWLKSYKTEEGA